MFSIAYRMTGSVGDAEDIVQEAFLRAEAASQTASQTSGDAADIDSPKSYLATITTRLAIDHLRSARVRRESYVGTWLPEPLLTDGGQGPAERAEMSDSLSMAFLVLMESLSPAERAVFLLREVFGYDYEEIAAATGRSQASCRQLFARARRAVDTGRPRFGSTRADAEELTGIFLDVANGGDISTLIGRLAPDVAFYGDSGGRGEVTFVAPVFGRDRVMGIISAQLARVIKRGAVLSPAALNGQPGFLVYDADGGLVVACVFDILDRQIQAIRTVANPDKLRHLGPISRTWHLRTADD